MMFSDETVLFQGTQKNKDFDFENANVADCENLFTDYEKIPDTVSKRTVVIKTVETRDGEVKQLAQK